MVRISPASPPPPPASSRLGAGGLRARSIAYNGFQAREDKPRDVKVGDDTKSTVLRASWARRR